MHQKNALTAVAAVTAVSLSVVVGGGRRGQQRLGLGASATGWATHQHAVPIRSQDDAKSHYEDHSCSHDHTHRDGNEMSGHGRRVAQGARLS